MTLAVGSLLSSCRTTHKGMCSKALIQVAAGIPESDQQAVSGSA